jgi:hypothetical protein
MIGWIQVQIHNNVWNYKKMNRGIDDEQIDDDDDDVVSSLSKYSSPLLGWCGGVEDLSMEVARWQGSAMDVCEEDDFGG